MIEKEWLNCNSITSNVTSISTFYLKEPISAKLRIHVNLYALSNILFKFFMCIDFTTQTNNSLERLQSNVSIDVVERKIKWKRERNLT